MFTHKLTNFEDDFSAPSPGRTLSYTNLSPGKHTLLLNAINGDGFYSKQAETVLFVQKPYIYQMPAFWIISVITILGSLILLFYLKQRAIMKENLKLESMVLQRTAELNLEREKSDELLRAILPNEIAVELKDGIHSIGQNYNDVTILFADIVNFTKTSSDYSASEIVNALNDLFTLFDVRAQKMGVEKIKTIGDAYMATCGLPSLNEKHAQVMVEYAKGMIEDVRKYNTTAKIPFNIRIGLNSGPVTAGVIGKTKFIYDVWGNTVNVASRMETAAEAGHIRVSETVYKHLQDSDIKFSSPMECDIKGKGLMTTYDIL
ncbi:MAG: adenylate/guanylate cyclase domain-containing protein [Treponema sp.]|nr:adenylate/guanylate cyclase domain-containing protein [Treponema sp.]